MSNYELIKYAIQNKKQISAMYQGHYREMCPHALGIKEGQRQQVLCYQFGGNSSQGAISEGVWRCMRLDHLTDIQCKEGPWFTGNNHSRPQTCVDYIECEVIL